MLLKSGKRTREFSWGVFIFLVVFYVLGAFVIKQLFHSRLLDMIWLIANSARGNLISNARYNGIIVNYTFFQICLPVCYFTKIAAFCVVLIIALRIFGNSLYS